MTYSNIRHPDERVEPRGARSACKGIGSPTLAPRVERRRPSPRRSTLAGAIATLLFLAFGPSAVATATPLACPASAQAAVNAAPSGSTLDLSGCGPYSELVNISKPLTVIGLVDRNVAAQAQRGFVELSGGGITLRGAQLSGSSSGACLGIEGGSNYLIDASSFTNCAQEGIAVHGDFSQFTRVSGFTLTNSTIAGANTAGAYDPGNEAGGIKLVSVDGSTISGNTISGNNGPGIWYDGKSSASTVSGNHVSFNTHAGIMIETNTSGTVTGNAVWENGWGTSDYKAWAGWGGCILLSSSGGVSVTGNTLAWCPAGIGLIEQTRPDNPGTAAGDTTTGNAIAVDTGNATSVYAESGAPSNWGALSPNASATTAQLQAATIPIAPQPGH